MRCVSILLGMYILLSKVFKHVSPRRHNKVIKNVKHFFTSSENPTGNLIYSYQITNYKTLIIHIEVKQQLSLYHSPHIQVECVFYYTLNPLLGGCEFNETTLFRGCFVRDKSFEVIQVTNLPLYVN